MPATAIGVVARLGIAPVKGMAVVDLEAAAIRVDGIPGDRRFAVLDAADRLVNGKSLGPLATIVPELRDEPETLRLRFPDGSSVEGAVVTAEAVGAQFSGGQRAAHALDGPFDAALSEWAGGPLRLVRLDADGSGVDRASRKGAVTLVSTGSLAALAAMAGLAAPLDAHRFRMTCVVDGVAAYAEDEWLGRWIRIGDATVEPLGNVGRCAVTTHDPATGRRDLDTLELLARTRGDVPTSEPLPFGVWAEVVEPGTVRLGDPVTVLTGSPGRT